MKAITCFVWSFFFAVLLGLHACQTIKKLEAHAAETGIAAGGGALAVAAGGPAGPFILFGSMVVAAWVGESVRPSEQKAEPCSSVVVTGNGNTVNLKNETTNWWKWGALAALAATGLYAVPRYRKILNSAGSSLLAGARSAATHAGALVGAVHSERLKK